ncbi:MAG: isoleucine--tRNA ligase [Tenericutes bacterium]|nr:isoleucine--tRNA ligase [Mycoplasmatota bacterium]
MANKLTNYDFINNEKEILKYWENDNTFKKLLEKNKNGKKYRFIDGPITANNKMGIHHAWGRSMKDCFFRYKAMNGYTSHYRNGFDGQGLWVEVEVEKELGFKTKKDIEKFGLDNFTEACVARVKKYADIIKEQSKRLGQWMDWDNSYYTFTDENITSIWYFLKKCHEKGMIKQTFKPMPWCARCGTSLSEHEMTGSYHDVEHQAIFFKLPIIKEEYKALVWTTTPWTLSANAALAVNPDFDYVVVQMKDEPDKLLLCKSVFNKRFKGEGKILSEFKGRDLKDKEYETCFPEFDSQINVKHKIVLWDEVSSEDGSGIVHIAPGCGAEDFALSEIEDITKIIPIDENGIILDGFGFLTGKKAKEVNDEVFEELKQRNKLFLVHKIKHSYPFCWRCNEDILFRLVQEWAIDVDIVRNQLINNAATVEYNPKYQGKRMQDWLQNMGDWNISRRRFYGLPLPFYLCDCGHLEIIGSKEELRKKAIDYNIVDNLKELHRPWIDEVKIKCPKCEASVSRIPQVGDVWLDAGIVPFSTLKYFSDKDYWKEYFPAEYIIEGSEQIRLWFYSMLFMSTVLENQTPYESIGTTSMVVKEDGTKFSKSDKNGLTFDDVAENSGADAIRLTYLAIKPINDVRFGVNILEEAKKKLIAYFNMSVFFNTYAEIDKIDFVNYKLNIKKLNITDKWLIKVTDNFINEATIAMENHDTKTVCDLFDNFVDEVSNFYIRINRRRFWKGENDLDKQNAYYVLYNAIKSSSQIMAPIIPFITEYVWQNIVKEYNSLEPSSVHLSKWPNPSSLDIEEDIITKTNYIRTIITLGLQIRNEKQIKVRQPLSKIYLTLNDINIGEYKDIILSELNIKDIIIVDNLDELKDQYVTINFKEAGAILKNDINKVKELINNLSEEELQQLLIDLKQSDKIKIPEYNKLLPRNIFNINFKERNNIAITSENDIEIAIDINITEKLKAEGILRDIIRQCQVFRKEAGFKVSDRIVIEFETTTKDINEILKNNEDLLSNELLAKVTTIMDVSFQDKIEEKEYELIVKMSKQK